MSFDNAPRREHDDLGNLIHSKAVRAGKRTYFIDVKSTRDDDYFITITESRKRHDGDGASSFARQQLHLYKEDFDKFIDLTDKQAVKISTINQISPDEIMLNELDKIKSKMI